MSKWYELNAKKTAMLIVTAIIIFAVFAALQTWAMSFDVSAIPEQWQPPFTVVITLITSGGFTFAVSLGRNTIGYLRQYVMNEYKEDYDFKKLHKTWFYYYGIIGTALTVVTTLEVPPDWKTTIVSVVTLVSLILDFTLSEIKKLTEET